MNRTASDAIAAVIQVLIFFLEDSFIFFCVRVLITIIGDESVTKVLSHIIGVRKKTDSQKGVRKAKSLGISGIRDVVITNQMNILEKAIVWDQPNKTDLYTVRFS